MQYIRWLIKIHLKFKLLLYENVKLSTNFAKIIVEGCRYVFVSHEATQLCKRSTLTYCFS